MRSAPISLELFDFLVREAIRLKFAPGVQAALIAESEIAGFADFPFRRFLVEGAVRHPKYLAGRDAVRLITRILRGVEAAIAVELPFLTSDPSQNPAFDRAEIRANENVPTARR